MSTPRKKFWQRLLIVFLLVLGSTVAMVWSAPATFVYEQFSQRLQPLRLQGISGSWWQGTASQLSYAAIPLGALTWQLKPLTLLSGKAHGRLNLRGSQIQASTVFSGNSKQIGLNSTTAQFPASMLAPVLDTPALQLLGKITLNLPELVLEHGVITAATGTLQWTEVGVSGAAEARLGSIRIDFATRADGVVEGQIRDSGGVLRVNGNLELKGQRFQAEIRLQAGEGADPIRDEALLYIGERSADGGSLLRINGTIAKLF